MYLYDWNYLSFYNVSSHIILLVMIRRYASVVILYSPSHSINIIYSQLRHILYMLLPIFNPEFPL